MDVIEFLSASFGILSLLLLTGAAYREGDDFLRSKVKRCLKILRAVIFRYKLKAQARIFSNINNKPFVIACCFICIWFTTVSMFALNGASDEISQQFTGATFSIAIVMTELFVIIVFSIPLIFVVLFLLGLAIAWARKGGSDVSFVARLGVLSGIVGLILPLFR